ncbi:MAG: DMT family transporter [Telmatospirillum sp.]|nr:DMT family transporter [Telmatospirillum sp.]
MVVVALFSSFVLVSRLGLSTSLALPDIAALRFGIGGLMLLPVLLRSGIGGLTAAQALLLAVTGGLGFALCAYAGFALAPAAHGAVLLHGTLALTTALLLWLIGRGAPPRGQRIGLAIIALGILSMAWSGIAGLSPHLLLGDLCLLLASVCWSAYGITVRRLGVPAVRAAAIVNVTSAVLFLPVYAFLPGRRLFDAGWHDLVLQGVFQGVLIGGLSIFVYTRAVALLGASRTAQATAAVPALTTIGGALLLAEIPDLSSLAGIALVTIGVTTALRS